MSWQELQIIVVADDVARTEALLGLAGAVAISLADEGDEPLLEPLPGETPTWSCVRLTALFPPSAALGPTATDLRIALGVTGKMTLRTVSEEEWKGAWERRASTRRFGKALLLAAADAEASDPESVLVRLNLGLAFGTGEHPTTALCLEWLDAELRPGSRVMDYGCGSGILGIAALRLGASYAWAVDIDPQALSATRANARLNEVEDRLWTGTPGELPDIRADVVVANILAGTLYNLREVFTRCVGPGGQLVLSGILEAQGEDLRQHYANRFGPFTEERHDGWTLLSAPRRSAPASGASTARNR